MAPSFPYLLTQCRKAVLNGCIVKSDVQQLLKILPGEAQGAIATPPLPGFPFQPDRDISHLIRVWDTVGHEVRVIMLEVRAEVLVVSSEELGKRGR